MLVPVQRTFVPCCSLALHCPVVPVYRNIIQVGFSPILWKTLGLTLVYYAKLSNILEKSFLPYIESVTSIRMRHPSASVSLLHNLTAIYDNPKLDYHTNPTAVLLPGHHRDTDTLGTCPQCVVSTLDMLFYAAVNEAKNFLYSLIAWIIDKYLPCEASGSLRLISARSHVISSISCKISMIPALLLLCNSSILDKIALSMLVLFVSIIVYVNNISCLGWSGYYPPHPDY